MADQTYDIEKFAAHLGNALQFLKAPGGDQPQTANQTGQPDPIAALPATHAPGNGGATYPSGYSYSGGSGTSNWDDFYQGLLGKLGLPVTDANMAFMRAWNQAEGMSTDTNNPFATTQGAPGATSINSVGVKSYGSMEQGIQATAETLQNGYYDDIMSAMQSGTDPMQAAVAVANSPWGTGSLVMRVLGG